MQSSLPRTAGGRPRITIEPMGNWDAVIGMLNTLGPKVRRASMRAQLKVAKEIVKRVKRHLREQDLNWPPLAPTTVQEREKHGINSSRILYARGTYYNAIQAWSSDSRKMVFAGVKKGTMAVSYGGERRRMDVGQIAAIHEFSRGRKVPRRPLWNPTLKELGKEGMKLMFMGSLLYYLRMSGVPITPFRKIFNAR